MRLVLGTGTSVPKSSQTLALLPPPNPIHPPPLTPPSFPLSDCSHSVQLSLELWTFHSGPCLGTELSRCSCQHPLNWMQVGRISESPWTLTSELAAYQQLFSPCPQWSSGSQTVSQCVGERGQIETTKIRRALNVLVRFRQVSIKFSEPFEDLMASESILSEKYVVPGLVTFYVKKKNQVKQTTWLIKAQCAEKAQ